MHLTLLSRDVSVHSTRRLCEAGLQLGHQVDVVDPLSVDLTLGTGQPLVHQDGRLVRSTDVVLARFAQSVNTYGLAVLRQLQLRGAVLVNTAEAMLAVRDKLQLLQRMVQHDLPVPPTVIVRGAGRLKQLVERLGGFPVVVKLVAGPEKSGVIICESAASLEAAVEAVQSIGHELVVQRWVGPAGGTWTRVLVVGGQVAAAVRRTGLPGQPRRSDDDAFAKPVTVSTRQRELSVAAARVLGLDVAAVDLVHVRKVGPQLLDVHASPGLRDLEAATGEDLARPIVEYAFQKVRLRAPNAVSVREQGRRR